MTNLGSLLESRDITLLTNRHIVKAILFFSSHVCMWDLDHEEGWALENLCFRIVLLEKILESPLDSTEIKLVNPKGNQPWIFIGRTDAETEAPILWSPNAKSQLTGKDPDAGKEWGQEERGDETAGWHHWLNEHEFEQIPGDSNGTPLQYSCLENPMDGGAC